MTFVKLTADGKPVWISPDKIIGVTGNPAGGSFITDVAPAQNTGDIWRVEEKPEEVVRLIEEATNPMLPVRYFGHDIAFDVDRPGRIDIPLSALIVTDAGMTLKSNQDVFFDGKQISLFPF